MAEHSVNAVLGGRRCQAVALSEHFPRRQCHRLHRSRQHPFPKDAGVLGTTFGHFPKDAGVLGTTFGHFPKEAGVLGTTFGHFPKDEGEWGAGEEANGRCP